MSAGTAARLFICPSATAAERRTNSFLFRPPKRDAIQETGTRDAATDGFGQDGRRGLVADLAERDGRRPAHARLLVACERGRQRSTAVRLRVCPSAYAVSRRTNSSLSASSGNKRCGRLRRGQRQDRACGRGAHDHGASLSAGRAARELSGRAIAPSRETASRRSSVSGEDRRARKFSISRWSGVRDVWDDCGRVVRPRVETRRAPPRDEKQHERERAQGALPSGAARGQ
jgi:hypothetical protein